MLSLVYTALSQCFSGECVGEALGGLKESGASSSTHMVRLGLFVLILGVLGYK